MSEAKKEDINSSLPLPYEDDGTDYWQGPEQRATSAPGSTDDEFALYSAAGGASRPLDTNSR